MSARTTCAPAAPIALRHSVIPRFVPTGPTPDDWVDIGWNGARRRPWAWITKSACVYRVPDRPIRMSDGVVTALAKAGALSATLGDAAPAGSPAFEVLASEALPLIVVLWGTGKMVLPTMATRATAAAAPAIANKSLHERRRLPASRGVTAAVEILAARWACSAARLALIRLTRCSGMGSGSGSEDSKARTPVGSSSRDGSEQGGIRGLIRVFTSMLGRETVGEDGDVVTVD